MFNNTKRLKTTASNLTNLERTVIIYSYFHTCDVFIHNNNNPLFLLVG